MSAAVYWARTTAELIGRVNEVNVEVQGDSIVLDVYGLGRVSGQLWERIAEGQS